VAEANATTGATIQVAAGDYVLNGGSGKDIGDLQLLAPMTITGAARPPARRIRGHGLWRSRLRCVCGRDN